jgi:hypothetical protein
MGPAARIGRLGAQKGFAQEGHTLANNATAPPQVNRVWNSRFQIGHTGRIVNISIGADSSGNASLTVKGTVHEDAAGPVPGALRQAGSTGWPVISGARVNINDCQPSVVTGEFLWVGGILGGSGYAPAWNITSSSPATTANWLANATGSFAAPATTLTGVSAGNVQELDVTFRIQTSKL